MRRIDYGTAPLPPVLDYSGGGARQCPAAVPEMRVDCPACGASPCSRNGTGNSRARGGPSPEPPAVPAL